MATVEALPRTDSESEAEQMTEAKPKRVRGVVVRWDAGWGFVRVIETGAEYFVHWSAINAIGRRELKEGWLVEFEIGPRPNGADARLQANNVIVIEQADSMPRSEADDGAA